MTTTTAPQLLLAHHIKHMIAKHRKYQRTGNSSHGRASGVESKVDLSVAKLLALLYANPSAFELKGGAATREEYVRHIEFASHTFRGVINATTSTGRRPKRESRKEALAALQKSLSDITALSRRG